MIFFLSLELFELKLLGDCSYEQLITEHLFFLFWTLTAATGLIYIQVTNISVLGNALKLIVCDCSWWKFCGSSNWNKYFEINSSLYYQVFGLTKRHSIIFDFHYCSEAKTRLLKLNKQLNHNKFDLRSQILDDI